MHIKHRVQHFWKLFLQHEAELKIALQEQDSFQIARIEKDLKEFLKKTSGCFFELDYDNGFYELTFTPSGDKNAQLICDLLCKDAPKQLQEDWILNAYRMPLSSAAYRSVIQNGDVQISGSDILIYYNINEAMHTLDIKVYCEKWQGMEMDLKERLCAYFLELFIGELELEARISSIEIIDQKSQDEDVVLLPNFFEDICDIIMDKEWVEYSSPLSIFSVYKLDEMPVSKTLRNDMKMILTRHPLLNEQMLRKQDEVVRDFRALGGDFGYIYYEKRYEDEKEALLRQELERQLHSLLYDMSIAYCIGGALGEYYTYIDLAVFDIDALQIVLEKLREKLDFDIYYKPFIA